MYYSDFFGAFSLEFGLMNRKESLYIRRLAHTHTHSNACGRVPCFVVLGNQNLAFSFAAPTLTRAFIHLRSHSKVTSHHIIIIIGVNTHTHALAHNGTIIHAYTRWHIVMCIMCTLKAPSSEIRSKNTTQKS